VTVTDTRFLIDVLAGHPGAGGALAGLVEQRESLWMPAPVLHELMYGANLHAKPDEEARRVQDLALAVPVIPFDKAAAELAGRLEAELERDGQRPSRVDVQIAATALSRGGAVITRDKTFPRPAGLRVITY
jgi:tRNA(fMet)-specific endonuclease VapC